MIARRKEPFLNASTPARLMDPLSDVLRYLRPGRHTAAGFDFGEHWAVRFPSHSGIKCIALMSGQGWLQVDDVADAIQVTAGDCLLLPRGKPFRIASDLALPAFDTQASGAPFSTPDGSGGTRGFAAHFELPGTQGQFLLSALSPVVHIRKQARKARLRWCIEQMMIELGESEPGADAVLQQLATMILVQALRVHLASAPPGGTGWLYALADTKTAAAIEAMHSDPARRWTLQTLAKEAGLSRTSFALRFKSRVGQPPMEYLTRWRMLLAADRLSNTQLPISAVARQLGYESESAFRLAFRRVMGHPPRRGSQGPADPDDLAGTTNDAA